MVASEDTVVVVIVVAVVMEVMIVVIVNVGNGCTRSEHEARHDFSV